jgi:hypothetical protein
MLFGMARPMTSFLVVRKKFRKVVDSEQRQVVK